MHILITTFHCQCDSKERIDIIRINIKRIDTFVYDKCIAIQFYKWL